jgi:cytochrome d ubiquinol oxidase subunit II
VDALPVTHVFTVLLAACTITVAAVLWGWGAAQYPHVQLPGMTVAQAAAPRATLQATLTCVIVGMVLLIPSLTWLFVLFQRSDSRFRNPV